MVPEAAIAMLACARIGAVHSVVFGGFSAQSVADRIQDSQAKLVITADGGFRRGAVVPLKQNVDEALTLKDPQGELLAKTIERSSSSAAPTTKSSSRKAATSGGTSELENVDAHCPAEKMDSEAPLFILYTSGSTGKPKGILHTTGGYLLYAKLTSKYVFDLRDEDVYWCTADVGWVTGHSYVVYGPLANGATEPHVRRRPQLPRAGPLLAHHREIRRHDPLHRADGHPRVHEMGRRVADRSTTSAPCACSAPSANPSIPRRGCGTTSSSAASAAPSSIPGGRPKPAAS